MKRGHPQFDLGQTDGKNFQCLVVMPATGKICGQRFKCSPSRTAGSFIISQALGHIKAQMHIGKRAHTKANATANEKASTAVQQSLHNSFAAGDLAGTKTTCKSQTEQLYTQAQWYIYSTHVALYRSPAASCLMQRPAASCLMQPAACQQPATSKQIKQKPKTTPGQRWSQGGEHTQGRGGAKAEVEPRWTTPRWTTAPRWTTSGQRWRPGMAEVVRG